MTEIREGPGRASLVLVCAVAVVIGVVVAVLTSDVVLGVIVGAPCVAIGTGLLRLWTGGGTPRPRHP